MNDYREYSDDYRDKDITILILIISIAMVLASIYLVS